MITASDLADSLEGRREGHEWRCRCPVHGGRSLSVTEKAGRLLLVCRAGCRREEVIAELKRLGLWGGDTSYEAPPPAPPVQDDTERRADRASDLWDRARPIESGDPVHRYLTGRGIVLDTWPEELRCHPRLDYWEIVDGKSIKTGIFPCMLAAVRNLQGSPVALHRTYLTEDGHKAAVTAPKKLFKVRDLAGSAVRLFPPMDGSVGVAEGIEDALSAWVLWGLPTWATLGTSGLRSFEPPDDVREILILADRDENEAGQTAALELGDRLEEKGVAVRIRVPSGQKDINGLLMERVH